MKIISSKENDFVLNLVRKKSPSLKRVWIGLKLSSNKFYWHDRSVLVYKNWAQGEPNGKGNEPCVMMWLYGYSTAANPNRVPGTWNDTPCQVASRSPNGIVCERLS